MTMAWDGALPVPVLAGTRAHPSEVRSGLQAEPTHILNGLTDVKEQLEMGGV
jgi:hypothetical protein